MIRFITCLRRRPDVSPEQFRASWDNPEFDRLVERMAEAAGAVRHAKNATLAVGANAFVQEVRGTDEPFDGVLEYFVVHAGHMTDLQKSPEFLRLQQEMQAYQATFADFSRSASFFTEWREVR